MMLASNHRGWQESSFADSSALLKHTAVLLALYSAFLTLPLSVHTNTVLSSQHDEQGSELSWKLSFPP